MKFIAMSKRVAGVVDAEVMKHGEAEALAVFRLMQMGTFDQIHYSAAARACLPEAVTPAATMRDC